MGSGLTMNSRLVELIFLVFNNQDLQAKTGEDKRTANIWSSYSKVSENLEDTVPF
jgi:hypothetical protein